MPEQNSGNHPAYQEILDALPDSLHAAIIPTLKKWDAGVTQKMQEIHASYENLKPFQKLVDNNIDFDYAERAVILADQLQRDPAKVVSEINNSWELGFITPEQAQALQQAQQSSGNAEDDEFMYDGEDISKHPQFQQLKQALEEVQGSLTKQQQEEEQEAALAEFEAELDDLEAASTEKNLPFNRLFVTALMNQGVDGEEAVKQYHQVVAQGAGTQTTEQATDTNSSADEPPVVMGGNGQVGSGTPDGAVDFTKLSKNETSDIVAQMLAQAQESGQG